LKLFVVAGWQKNKAHSHGRSARVACANQGRDTGCHPTACSQTCGEDQMMRRSWVLAAIMIANLGAAYAQETTPAPAKSGAETKTATDAKAVDQEQAAQMDLLWAAQHQTEEGNTADAVATLDKIIGYYESKHPDAQSRWFVARTPQETLAYMMMAIADREKSRDKRSATALYALAWAEAYYMKGYALVELGQLDDAKAALEHAIQLMPYNSKYLSELGNIYQGEKNWTKSLDLYKRAEDGAAFTPKDQQVSDTTRAKRGLGYVLVELNRLDEAEAKYKECLVLDPKDSKSQQELEYVRTVRAQGK
jgi:tetratricopeptide (TPR) repeat protein